MTPGDWITQVKLVEVVGSEGPFPFELSREFYEFVLIDYYTYPKGVIKAWPIYLDNDPPIDRTKRPHHLKVGEWRLATDEEKAELVANRFRGRK